MNFSIPNANFGFWFKKLSVLTVEVGLDAAKWTEFVERGPPGKLGSAFKTKEIDLLLKIMYVKIINIHRYVHCKISSFFWMPCRICSIVFTSLICSLYNWGGTLLCPPSHTLRPGEGLNTSPCWQPRGRSPSWSSSRWWCACFPWRRTWGGCFQWQDHRHLWGE